jgi:lipopolysaccharide export system permease protein
MIINRYLNKEIFNTLFAVTLILMLVFLSQQTVRYLGYAASGKIASNILLPLLGFEIPYLLVLLLPLGLYLGMFLVLSRLYADSEMFVLNASGCGSFQLMRATLPLTFLVAMIVMVLSLWVNPWIASQKGKLIAKGMTEENILKTLMPGRFHVSSDGRRVIYVESISQRHKQAENLFIAEEKKGAKEQGEKTNQVIISATQGAPLYDKTLNEHFVVATKGYRYEGVPGQNEYKIIQFKKYAVHIPDATFASDRELQEGVPTARLWKEYSKPNYAAELQWRFSLAVAPLLLALLVFPLSRVNPRQGRYLMMIPTLLIYSIYINLLFVARHGVELGTIPAYLGMWWVHILCFMVGLFLLGSRFGWRFFPARWRVQ